MKTEIEKLKEKYKEIEKKIATLEDECAKSGKSFEDMIEETKKERTSLYMLSKEIRLVQEPTIEFGKRWKGDTLTLEDFITLSKDGELTDNDGYGFYATETGKSDIEIIPSDIIENKYRNDFTHVIWFGK